MAAFSFDSISVNPGTEQYETLHMAKDHGFDGIYFLQEFDAKIMKIKHIFLPYSKTLVDTKTLVYP